MITTYNLPTSLTIAPQVLDGNYTKIDVARQLVHPSVTSIAKRMIDILGAVVGLGITAVVAIPVALATQLG